jgi:hypothetical protein
VASASADRTVRVDLATLVGLGLAGLAFFAGLRDLSLIRRLVEMPYISGTDVLLSQPDVLTGLFVPAIGLLTLAVVLSYAAVFDRWSAIPVLLTIGLLYWSGGLAFALAGVVLAGAFYVLSVVSTHAGPQRN